MGELITQTCHPVSAIIRNISKSGKAISLTKYFCLSRKTRAQLQYAYKMCIKFQTDRLKQLKELIIFCHPVSALTHIYLV